MTTTPTPHALPGTVIAQFDLTPWYRRSGVVWITTDGDSLDLFACGYTPVDGPPVVVGDGVKPDDVSDVGTALLDLAVVAEWLPEDHDLTTIQDLTYLG